MAEEDSYPKGPNADLPDEAKTLTMEQWSSVTQGMGQGIMDHGTTPYWLSNVDSVNDQVTILPHRYPGVNPIAPCESSLAGFYHRLNTAVTLKVKPVSTTTTYQIGVRYDPAAEAMPLKLAAWTLPADASNGKRYLPMWAITRQPNQALSAATVTQYRQRIAPQISVTSVQHLPKVTDHLVDTIARVRDTGDMWRLNVSGTSTMVWERFEDRQIVPFRPCPGWDLSDSPVNGLITSTTTEGKTLVEMSMRWRRTEASFSFGTAWKAHGWPIPTNLCPSSPVDAFCNVGTDPNTTLVLASLRTDGWLQTRTLSGTAALPKGGAITALNMTWTV